jgi:hypothetical protein
MFSKFGGVSLQCHELFFYEVKFFHNLEKLFKFLMYAEAMCATFASQHITNLALQAVALDLVFLDFSTNESDGETSCSVHTSSSKSMANNTYFNGALM